MKKAKLFGERISPACRHCALNLAVSQEAVYCTHAQKVQKPDDCCRKYRYDPLRREPKVLPQMPEMSAKDFLL